MTSKILKIEIVISETEALSIINALNSGIDVFKPGFQKDDAFKFKSLLQSNFVNCVPGIHSTKGAF